jgi:hypothetical protein
MNPLFSHPIPDIPVIGNFNSDGNSSIFVEIDPRSFAEDPESIPFITEETFKDLPDSNKTELLQKAKEMIRNAFDLRFGETSWFLPDFDLSFTEKDGGDLSEDNIVYIEGRYDTLLDTNASFYQIRAKEDAPYDLIFTNQINGKPQRRVNVLFPDEESFKFDLSFIDGEPIAQLQVDQAVPVSADPKNETKEFRAENNSRKNCGRETRRCKKHLLFFCQAGFCSCSTPWT